MPRCKICKDKFDPKYFLQKTCSKVCKHIYEKSEPKRAIKKISDKRKTEEKTYRLIRKQHLILFPNCELCKTKATEIHHKNGREGKRLYDNNFFMSICRICHNYIHANPKESREKKWLL